MPQTNGLGQSRHRFQVGKGLYTKSDLERGSSPTPSQARRGVSPDSSDARWFELDRGTKQLWQDAAQLGQSGRRLFSTVNRIRPYFQLAPTDTPPAGPQLPILYPISNPRCYAANGAGEDAFFVLDVDIPDDPITLYEAFEFAYYIARQPATGPVIRAAEWYSCNANFAFYAPFDSLNMLWSIGYRSVAGDTRDRRTLPAGSPIQVRLTPCTDQGYPGPAIRLNLVVLPTIG